MLILPKTYIPVHEIRLPFFSLLGPIRGGDDWQVDAYHYLSEKFGEDGFIAFIPNRWSADHDLYKFKMDGHDDRFESQTLCERYYIELAALGHLHGIKYGCAIMWKPCESKVNPRTDGHPYARDSYGEEGELRGLMRFQRVRLVIGADPNFPGLEQQQKNLDAITQDRFPVFGIERRKPFTRFPIYSSLTDTIDAGILVAGFDG